MEHLVLASITETITNLIKDWYLSFGYFGIVLAMAIESCCIPLPSEIVMPLAGVYIAGAADTSNPWLALVGVAVAGAAGCLIGSIVAYGIGRAGGRPLLLKYGRFVLISQADSDRADRWFARFGPSVAFFSRLLPVVRTYISLPAGIYRMNFLKFCLYTVLGSLPWCFLLAFAGFKLKDQYEKLSTYFHGADIVIGIVLVVLVALYVYRHIKHDRAARAALAARQAQAASAAEDWSNGRSYGMPGAPRQPARPDQQMPRRPAGPQQPGQRDPYRGDVRGEPRR